MWAACYLAFSAFLRSEEFTCTKWDFYDHYMLSLMDITIDSHTNPTILHIILRWSKMDVIGTGVTIHLRRTGDTLCPVAALCHTSHAVSQLRVHSCSSLESHYLDTNLWLQSDRYCHQLGWTFLDSMATALESEQQLQQPRQASLTWPFSSSDGGNPLHTHATFAHQSTLSQPHHGNSSNLLSNHILILLLNPVLSSHCDHLLLLLFTGIADCYPFTEALCDSDQS